MSSLLSLYFLHPITTRLANKTQRFYPRYELTNPTKTPPPPFVFSLLSVILLHLHYTLQPPSPLFPIPFSLCYYLPFLCYSVSYSPVTTSRSFVTLSPHPLLLPFVLMLPCLLFPCYYPLFLCYSVSSYPVSPLLTLCYYPLFLCYSVFSYSVTSYSVSPVPPSLSCKECLPVLSTGAFTLSKTRLFKHAEHALLAP